MWAFLLLLVYVDDNVIVSIGRTINLGIEYQLSVNFMLASDFKNGLFVRGVFDRTALRWRHDDDRTRHE